MIIADKIVSLRKRAGWSQEELAEKLGVSRQAISKWESDAALPDVDKLIGLARKFNVTVGWLLGVEENSPRQEEELTDTQLKMVEEIVKRYQPAREAGKKKFHWEFGIPLLAVALAAAALIFSFARKHDDPAANSEQLSSLQASYSGIQGSCRISAPGWTRWRTPAWSACCWTTSSTLTAWIKPEIRYL